MLKYVARRIFLLIPVMLGVSFIIFSVINLAPGDPAVAILGESATPDAIEALHKEMGLDKPFIVRYLNYMAGVVRGDFGESYRTGVPVVTELVDRFPHTLKLATFGGILVAVCLGLPIGIISAVKQYSFADTAAMLLALLLTSTPGFWLALLSILLFSLHLGWFPSTGVDTWKHFVLPIFVVGASSMSTLTRMTRSTMLETIRQDYIRTARAKGASERTITFRHALRNALLPVITVVGTNFGNQLGGTVMIESVFAIPGVGSYLVQAVRLKDIPAVTGTLLVTCLLAGIVNLIVDLVFALIDPRVKAQYSGR